MRLGVMWSTVVFDSRGVTEVVAACSERQVFTRGRTHAQQQQQKKNKSKRTWEACRRETGDQSANNELSSPTVSLPVFGYGLMSPLAPPRALVSGEQ